MKQWGRIWRVSLGPVEVSGNDLAFRAVRTLRLEPNQCSVEVYNLAEATRTKIAGATRATVADPASEVIIEAGYGRTLGLVFRGDLVAADSRHAGADWVTVVRGGDGEVGLRSGTTFATFPTGADLADVAEKLAKDLDLKLGRLKERLKARDYPGAWQVFKRGLTAAGNSQDLLRDLGRTTGLDISVQDGEVVALRPGESLNPAVYLDAESGLVGSPERAEGGTVTARSLLNPLLQPGRGVRLAGETMQGEFRVVQVAHHGNTSVGDWYSDVELEALDALPAEGRSVAFA